MIRPVVEQDGPEAAAVAVSAELFAAEDAEIVHQLMAAYFSRDREAGHRCVVEADDPGGSDDGDGVLGVAYYQPAAATEGSWYLTMIAIRPDRQQHGLGTGLLRYVENDLRQRGQRLLLVETSALASFESARRFYRRCGYEQEARVRDYYQPGDDMILFRRELTR